MSGLFGGSRKDNSRRKGMPAMWKAERKAEAAVRQAAYNNLTLEEKLARATGKRQKAKLLKLKQGELK